MKRLTLGGFVLDRIAPDTNNFRWERATSNKWGQHAHLVSHHALVALVVPATTARRRAALEDWTHDGRFLILGLGERNILALPLDGDRKPIALVESSSMVDEPHVSRDGRWLAYSANETGQWEVFVQPFMRTGGRVRVSSSSGSQPRWRADGKELFYLGLDGALMSVDTSDPVNPGAPRKLFETRFWVNPLEDQYDVTADGQRSS